ncbi:MAG: hypothetical protein IJ463_06440 [Bacilli bacterium]|nr:hypothetical protein [Bacilli bacterium]
MKDTLMQKIVSVSLPLSILLTFSVMLPTTVAVVVTLVGTSVAAPLLDRKFTEIKDREDKNKIREQHYIQQLKISLAEMDKKGTRVNRMTPFFNDMIMAKCNEKKIIIDEDTLQNINQFLYMVNANYYERILDSFKVNNERLRTREDVLREMCDAILRHMEINEDYSFDDTDVQEILNICLFIKDDVKVDMIEEFENSKVPGVLGTYRYIIERKDVKRESIEKDYTKNYDEVNKEDVSFDIYEKDSYIAAITKITEMPHYQKLGNINAVSWDIDALMDIVTKLIQKYNSELERNIPDYSIAKFTVKLMLVSASYALVNKKGTISYKVITEAFKKLPNIPNELFMDMSKYLDKLCADKALEKPNQKIIIFNPNYLKNQK